MTRDALRRVRRTIRPLDRRTAAERRAPDSIVDAIDFDRNGNVVAETDGEDILTSCTVTLSRHITADPTALGRV